MTNFLDFWFADFRWYRNITENENFEWMRKEIESEAGIHSEWMRVPKGTFLILEAVNDMIENYPNVNELTDQEKRDIIQNYLDKYAKNEEGA